MPLTAPPTLAPQNRMKDWRYWLAEQRGTLMAVGIFVVMFLIYVSEPPRRLHPQRGADRRQQGHASRLRRRGPGAGGDHRRHRPLGRHGADADQLPRLLARGRHRPRDRPRRPRRPRRRPRLRRAQRPHRHLRPPPAHRHHHRHRRRLLRPRADAAPLPRRLGERGPRRRPDRPRLRHRPRQPRRAGRRRRSSSGSPTAARSSAAPPTPPAPPRSPPTCPACRSSSPSSPPTPWPASSPPSAGSSSPSTPTPARPPTPPATPTPSTPSPPSSSAASRSSGGRGSAIGAIFGALAFRTIGDLLFVFDLDPLWQPLFQGVVLAARRQHRRLRADARAQPPGLVRMSDASRERAPQPPARPPAPGRPRRPHLLRLHPPAPAHRQHLLAELPLLRLPDAAAQGRLLPRRHRHRHDAGDPARPDRPLRALGRLHRRDDGQRRRRLRRHRRDPLGPLRHPLRRRHRPRERLRRRLPAHPLDDRDARHQRRRPGPHGRLHRRLLAPGLRLARHALARHRLR